MFLIQLNSLLSRVKECRIIETFSKLRFFWFKKLTQMSLGFKTSCCNLKIRGLGAKLCVAFLLF